MLSWGDFIKGLNVFRSLEGLWLDIYNMIYLPRDRLRSLERYCLSSAINVLWGDSFGNFNMGWSGQPHDHGDGARIPILINLQLRYNPKKGLHGVRHRIDAV